jgi:prephenate dehydrogenase
MLDFIARIVGQNPHLYASIQMHNPFVLEVHETFLSEASKLSETVKKGDVDGFVKIMASSARIFKDVDSSMGKSDKAISALTTELKKLKESLGKEVAVRHIYSRKVHQGAVVFVDPETVAIKKRGRSLKLKLSNIELLSDEETNAWRIEQGQLKKTDFSFEFPVEADEHLLARVIKNSRDTIISCEVVDVFKGEQLPLGKKSVTFRVLSVNQKDALKVQELLKGLGGKLR